MTAPRTPFLDRPIARLCALGVVAAVAGALLAIHWDDLFGAEEKAAASGNPELAACLDKRLGDVAAMLEDGTIDQRQAEQFRQRARSFCRAEHGAGGGPPGAGGGLGLPQGMGD